MVITGRYDDGEHRTNVLVEDHGREVRFDVADIPDDTYGYSRAERVLVGANLPIDPRDRVGLWQRPDDYRWLVRVFAEAGLGDAEVGRVLAAVRAGMGTKEFRFVF
ncbi:MAG: hypothetical protein NTX33_17835 [Propionibacteriales bacterium]|nr:hypothetical protein [Propionibacteriales bacterium]